MATTKNNKLKVRDIIAVVLLSLINVVILFASSLLYATPITIILMPVFFSLLESVVLFIIGTNVKKPGSILIYYLIWEILGGYLPLYHSLYSFGRNCGTSAEVFADIQSLRVISYELETIVGEDY